jgi:hypothetical protein
MGDRSEMQFYVGREIDEAALVTALTEALGIPVETLDHPNPAARAFLIVTRYATGFPIGASVAWPAGLGPRGDHLRVAAWLAKRFGTPVATDSPAAPGGPDPYLWWVAQPDGALVEMAEDLQGPDSEGRGLVLDATSRRPIPHPPGVEEQHDRRA